MKYKEFERDKFLSELLILKIKLMSCGFMKRGGDFVNVDQMKFLDFTNSPKRKVLHLPKTSKTEFNNFETSKTLNISLLST
jgi:hypothetical protein